MGTKVVTAKIRASYVNVFKPRLNDLNGAEEYSMQLIIPKSDTYTVNKIQAAIDAAKEKKWSGKAPGNIRNPLRDADAEAAESGDPVKDHLKGCYFMNVKSREKPGVVDSQREEILDPQQFRSGDYCKVAMNASAYDQKGNKGVSFWLHNVQVLEEGVPLGGRSRPEDDFDDIDDPADDWAA